jgi:hypothetical protein
VTKNSLYRKGFLVAQFTRTDVVPASEEPSLDNIVDRLRQRLQEVVDQFRSQPVTPLATYQFEKDLQPAFDQAGREILAEVLNHVQPADKQQVAAKVRYHKTTYRINKRTKATIATSFGDITVWSFYYLNEEDGEPGLHPLHVQLGIVASTTPVLAERVARWAIDHSQSEVRQLLTAEHGLRWSNDRLRRVLREYRRMVVMFCAEAQAERLLKWLADAERSRGRNRPVLAVGRDGVMVPVREGGPYQEASAGTVSVYDRRKKRLGTVYLGQMPESEQVTMTTELTDLIETVLRDWTGPVPRLVYVTDKGQAQDKYFRRVLKRMRHPRNSNERLKWEWVLDFFHAASYVGKLSEALFGKSPKEAKRWFGRMRHWLRDRDQGVTQVLRSAMQHYNRRKLSKGEDEEFWKAYRYLRKHSRLMDYARYRRQGLPIGSGVTEAACKTVFTQRLKRSGMRWGKEFGQVIVDLRVIYLSGIWEEVVRRDLTLRPQPERIERGSGKPQARKKLRKAA